MKSFSGLLASCLLLLCSSGLRSQTIEQIVDNGPSDKRINIVLLSEGYTQAQLPRFHDDAVKLLNALLDAEPYREYRNYFNAYAISVASVDSGSDHPSTGINRDSYFNSSFDSYGIQRLVTIPPNDLNGNYSDGHGKVDALLQTLMPEYDIAAVIVNDETYGGSGGSVLVMSTNASSAEVIIHEVGHTFGHL